jgi:transcription-repair coupling factor (superfamily II helicase)
VAAHVLFRRGPLVLLVPTEGQARSLHGTLEALLGEGGAPALLPAPDADPYEGLPSHPGILLKRAAALTRLLLEARPAVVLSAESLLHRVPRREWWRNHVLLLDRGLEMDRRELRLRLWTLGYRPVDLGGEAGVAAFRGGIVDLFPPAENLPVRLEFFGDEVESLRFFDPVSQQSLAEVGRKVAVHPLSEAVRDEAVLAPLRRRLEEEGVRAKAIHGDLRQNLRERALSDFSDGKLAALVNTIPVAVTGGLAIYLFGVIGKQGIALIQSERVNLFDPKNLAIGATILVLGIGGNLGLKDGLFPFQIPVLFPNGIPAIVFAAIVGILINAVFVWLPPSKFGVQERSNIEF